MIKRSLLFALIVSMFSFRMLVAAIGPLGPAMFDNATEQEAWDYITNKASSGAKPKAKIAYAAKFKHEYDPTKPPSSGPVLQDWPLEFITAYSQIKVGTYKGTAQDLTNLLADYKGLSAANYTAKNAPPSDFEAVLQAKIAEMNAPKTDVISDLGGNVEAAYNEVLNAAKALNTTINGLQNNKGPEVKVRLTTDLQGILAA